ncbi:asparagine synthase (glutamine-hydrolyzing) [Egbenema bharatensis]|uniref:asparagine synthase (glutamine-hydrolyzing) n=1 Tax=Egbenema bharatensis TaxID=3463334 RepID=UPI003A8C0C09
MCGITGFLTGSQQRSVDAMVNIVRPMTTTLHHRGPDDQGIWIDPQYDLALGHRRLSILDLSTEGHQPMVSADGRYVVAFNGEIYNFLALKQELGQLGHRFRGHSDTEVMLASFSRWGVQRAVQQFNGMFAFALWDRQERLLHLGRDRLGEKPLYYGWMGQTLLFGSELKALKAHPDFQAEIDRNALTAFLRYNHVPAPYSIYQGVYKLLPGTLLTWDGSADRPQPVPYWSAKAMAELGAAEPFTGTESEALSHLEFLLKDAVQLRMIADVPLGAFLSGGIDSSTIVALMQAQSHRPVKTFTIGFHESAYNEAPYARRVAQHLGTEHTELYVTPQQTLDVIPKLPTLYDEPFADASQIPTFLVSQLVRQYVTVCLSGDGGDELFGGYNRHVWARNIWQKMGWMPFPLRKLAGQMLTARSPQAWNDGFEQFRPFLPQVLKQPLAGNKLHKLAEILTVPNAKAMHLQLVSHWKQPESVTLQGTEPTTQLLDRHNWADLPDFTQRIMYMDTVTTLPDDMLVKVDRASMGVALEVRVPFLDHRVAEFSWRLPIDFQIRGIQGKWLLRQLLDQYVPKTLIERPKMGFGIPLDRWLRGSLQEWAEALLDEARLQQEGFFDPQPIRQKWTEHLAGDRNWEYLLWDVLMFQAWLEEQHRELAKPPIDQSSATVLIAAER